MTKRIRIHMNVANALQWLGTLYRNPADAIKEHVSNAIDEHKKAVEQGVARDRCPVTFRISKKEITIEYPYGLTREEFESALQRVADSVKRHSKVGQIGQLGIGIFSFQQIGRKCTFFTRKNGVAETTRVILREGTDEAEFDRALKRDGLPEPGIRIVISELKFDPMKSRGPLAPDKLKRLFAEKFGSYLQKGWLEIEVSVGSDKFVIQPPTIDLPRIGMGLEDLVLSGFPRRVARLTLYFDPSGMGALSIRHSGVVVVEDLSKITAYGLEDSVFASGFVQGSIDADFLQPLPARTGFEETQEWVDLLDLLDNCKLQIEAEVEALKIQEQEKEQAEVQDRAVQLAREILNLEDFRDLELPGGLSRTTSPSQDGRAAASGDRTGERSSQPGDRPERQGPRIRYEEIAFPNGSRLHSKYVTGVVLGNTLNPDHKQEIASGPEAKLAYAALLIGKEAIAFDDKSGVSDEQLEKLLSYHFRLKNRMNDPGVVPGLKTVRTKRKAKRTIKQIV